VHPIDPDRDGQAVRLEDLVLQSMVCADRLARLGVGHGDRVALVLGAGPDFVVALLGLWRLGAVAVPLRPHGGKVFDYTAHLKRVARVCGLRGVIADDGAARTTLEQAVAITAASHRHPSLPGCPCRIIWASLQGFCCPSTRAATTSSPPRLST
jgi:acyl-CoA synthetase (AMP-forming)/AMP-acid ligase II